MIVFEQKHQRHVWRIESTAWNGERRLQVWPWFEPNGGGDLRPCAARYQSGFAIPLDRLDELIASLKAVRDVERSGQSPSPDNTA